MPVNTSTLRGSNKVRAQLVVVVVTVPADGLIVLAVHRLRALLELRVVLLPDWLESLRLTLKEDFQTTFGAPKTT